MKPAKCDTMLRSMISGAEMLIERHREVLGRELDNTQDCEAVDLLEIIKDSEEALAELYRREHAHMTVVPTRPIRIR